MGENALKKNKAREGDTGSAQWGEAGLGFRYQDLARPR